MIEVNDMTLTYPGGKGVFDLSFTVKDGEITGYLGPNGSGKTTTIRALLGFMSPDKGICRINGLDCVAESPAVQKKLGYIPGEISFPDGMNGDEFLKVLSDMRRVRNIVLEKRLSDMFELNPKGKIRKFSKGMKQKLGIIAAFMHDPDVYILDEPTGGLDPLMQNRFVELLLSEKAAGKTVLMSSHIFEEVEKTCDNTLIIKDGRIVAQSDIKTLKSSQRKAFSIGCEDSEKAVEIYKSKGFEVVNVQDGILDIYVAGDKIDTFIKTAAAMKVLSFDTKNQTLEDVFMHFYGKEGVS